MAQTIVIEAMPLVPGLSAGIAFQYRDIMTRKLQAYNLEEDQMEAEFKRIQEALQTVDRDLDQMKQKVEKQVDAKQAAVFDVHRMILKDLVLVRELEEELRRRKVNAEAVVHDVFRRWEKKFKTSDSEQVQDKADDVQDIGRRLLRILMGIEGNVLQKTPKDSVIFAPRLLPSDTVHLNSRRVNGIVTQEAGHNSHVTILARALNIPLISKVGEQLNQVPDGACVILDGKKGTITVHPPASEYERVLRHKEAALKEETALARKTAGLSLDLHGKPVKVMANTSSDEETRLAAQFCADGIGLYRIEQLYMSSSTLPSEKDLARSLSKALDPVKDKEITVRLLDIGADKTLPYIQMTEERNAALGTRGIRLLLQFPDLLETQLRVLLSLSDRFQIRILIPMVTLAQDVAEVKKILEGEKKKLRQKKQPFARNLPLGTMIETPAAALAIDEILPLVDFISIGTNDLTQYLMVADRENINVSKYYGSGDRYLFPWVRDIIAKAEKAGKDCELCGELAGDTHYTKKLLQCGLRSFSVTPHLIPEMKLRIDKMRLQV